MRKILILIITVAMPIVLSAEYQSMTFKTASGAEHAVNAKNLEMTVSGENLEIKTETATLSLALSDLVSMQFTGNATSADNSIVSDEDYTVKIYSLSGAACGEFDSLQAAMNGLDKGVYVAKQKDGLTVKIVVK